MKKLALAALIGAISLAGGAYAADTSLQSDANDVGEDVGAVHKDNAALAKDNAQTAHDRALKAQAKANGNYGAQAADSLALGADHTVNGEKKVEKSTDKKILSQDQKNLNNGIAKENGQE